MQQFFSFLWARRAEILLRLGEHLWLSGIALALAIAIGVGLGILLADRPRAAGPVIGLVSAIQTIPSLALLGFLLPLLGIGAAPAIVALFLYALLPIVQNTYTGLTGVDPLLKEAGLGLGMTPRQLLTRVTLPLAVPTLFAGVRTSVVLTVGIATIAALIGAGGLGDFIFRGIASNDPNLVLAGAVPAALLAIGLDQGLAWLQRHLKASLKPLLIVLLACFTATVVYAGVNWFAARPFTAGFPSEFMERADGYPGLRTAYGLNCGTRELEIGLMYQALHRHEVDMISGFSTDGRIAAYHLKLLTDNRHYFPPYYAAPIVRGQALRHYPELAGALALLNGRITEAAMRQMNYAVEVLHHSPREAATAYAKSIGLPTTVQRQGRAEITIGSKNFTEQYVLSELFKLVIENHTGLTVALKTNLGSAEIAFEALKRGSIDLYPEYTGTALEVLLHTEPALRATLKNDKDSIYKYVAGQFATRYDVTWLPPLGFNNTHALMLNADFATVHKLETISDLVGYLKREE